MKAIQPPRRNAPKMILPKDKEARKIGRKKGRKRGWIRTYAEASAPIWRFWNQ